MLKALRNPPWYAAGLAFECAQCGRCCSGPEEGYVWVSGQEIREIAQYLGMSLEEMSARYTRNVHGRYSLTEHNPSNNCIFVRARRDGTQTCAIYPVRPPQCRSWPFWNSNLRDPESWALAALRCPGINRGPLLCCDEIEARRRATTE